MPFEVFDKRLTPLTKAPSLTLQRKGIISINRAAMALISSPSAVELMWDKERQVIGLRAADDSVSHAYDVRPQSPKKETGPVIIAGTAFCSYYKIDTSTSRRFTPVVEDGVLCVNLADGVEIVGNRAFREAHEADEG